MGSPWEPWHSLPKKGNHILLKLFVSVLLMGLSFRLFSSLSSTFLPTMLESPIDIQLVEKLNVSDTMIPQVPLDVDEQGSRTDIQLVEKPNVSDNMIPQRPLDVDEQGSRTVNCDLFSGKWTQNPSEPAYTNVSCPFIEDPQNCMKNGRPDTGYLHWRWKPHGCDVPPFNSEKFLKAMRDKSWAFIGDSILRNHGQSLVCLLSKAESPVEIYHDEDYKSRSWHFPAHNFTLSLIWSPFLAKADIFENDSGVSKSEIQLHLNTLNAKWTKDYHTHDYILISVGQWFLKTAVYWENDKVIGCHYCPRLNLTERGMDYAYRKVLQLVFRFITKSEHKPLIFYRTWTPDHFEGGEWFTGGICNGTLPYGEDEYNGRDVDRVMHRIELEEFNKVAINGSEVGTHMKLLDTYRLSLLRPDGHPGPYRSFHPFDKDKNGNVQNDCLHWCLPGPIDSWNDLLMKMVVKG